MASIIEGPDGRLLVELYCAKGDCDATERLVAAVANSVRWRDRLEVRVERTAAAVPVSTPYGPILDDTIVVCGTHLIRGANYHALTRALEDCDDGEPQ